MQTKPKICVTALIYICIFLNDVSPCHQEYGANANDGTLVKTPPNQTSEPRWNFIKDLHGLFKHMNEVVLMLKNRITGVMWQFWTASEQNLDMDVPSLKQYRKWSLNICNAFTAMQHQLFSESLKRQAYLFCRGPVYNDYEDSLRSATLEDLEAIYTGTEICISTRKYGMNIGGKHDKSVKVMSKNIATFLQNVRDEIFEAGFYDRDVLMDVAVMQSKNLDSTYVDIGEGNAVVCYAGEPGLVRLMAESRDEDVLRFAWLAWRESVGPPMKTVYTSLVKVENSGAKRNGYRDIGEAWRKELEIPNLEELIQKLYGEIKPLYTALHGVARFFLNRYYGDSIVPKSGPIPAHVLGDLWSQDWVSIIDLILPISKNQDFEANIKNTNWTTIDMIKHAENYYASMGLPKMTEQFWNYSVFEEQSNSENGKNKIKCHGTAVDMFQKNDYRIIYCAGLSIEDFYVVHHELGHIQYYMAYKDLPVVFRDGANSAFQESIGDAIMYGVLTPQHLQRLGLVENESVSSDAHLEVENLNKSNIIGRAYQYYEKTDEQEMPESEMPSFEGTGNIRKPSFDEILLLRQALNKIPQIPFSLIIDIYRWRIFSGDIEERNYNKEFWKLVHEYQGIMAPDGHTRGEKYFDAGTKFHVPDHTPYVRYFLSSFVQMQMFRGLCAETVMERGEGATLPRSLPLHRCDLYGSKAAGRKLRNMLSKGCSIRWDEALQIVSGEDQISADALIEYFEPLKPLLARLIKTNNIKLGW